MIERVTFVDTLQNSFLDDIENIQKEVKARNEVTKESEQKNNDKNTNAADKISLSRSEVISRAESMRSYYWVLNAKHKVVRESTSLPKVVQDATVERSFQGIPYCWGGFLVCPTHPLLARMEGNSRIKLLLFSVMGQCIWRET